MNELNELAGEDDDPLSALLLAWEESLAAGTPLPVATLCADLPELADQLEREIALLQSLDGFMLAPNDLAERVTLDASHLPNAKKQVVSHVGFEIPGFEILDELGRGGMGVVYRARQKSLNRLVAIKTLAGGRWAEPGFVARLRREAKALSQLNDPHVVQVFEIIDTPASVSLVLEYVDGGNLAARLHWMPLSPIEAGRIALTLARTISTVHQQGLYHRDIKPANILLDRAGNIKIADFGLAKEEGSVGRQTATGDFFGTPSYMAPEQAQGRKVEIDARTDVYAIGATLYEMLTGRPPFSGASTVDILKQLLDRDPIAPRLLIPKIPRDLETICLKCLEKDPKKRFDSAQELADELDRSLQGLPIHSRPIGAFDRLLKWCKRRPAAAGLIGVSIAGMVAIASLVLFNNQRLKKYNQDLIAAVEKANELQRVAEDNERRAKDGMYASDISRAAVAWKQEDTRELTELLDRHRPRPGKIDRRGFEWWYLYRQAKRARRMLLETFQPMYTLCYSPDRKWLAAAGKDAIVRFLNPDTGEASKEFATGQKEVNGVTFSPNGTEFATAGDDGTIRIWTIETGNERLKISTPFRKVFELVYTSDGTRIIACGISPVIHIFDVHSGQEVARLEGHTDVVENLRLSDEGRTLVSLSNDSTIRFWNLDERMLVASIDTRERGRSMVYNQNRRIVITGNNFGELRTIDVGQNREIDSVKQIDGVNSLALHPDGALLAVGDDNGQIRLRGIDREGRFINEKFQAWQAHRGRIYSLVWSTDNSRLISAGKDGRILSWSVAAARRAEPRRFVIDPSTDDWPVSQLPTMVLMRPADGAFLRWSLRTGRPPVASNGRFRREFCSSGDGKLFAAVDQSETLQLFAVPDDSEQPIDAHKLAEWRSPNKLVIDGFLPDSQRLVLHDVYGDMMGSGEDSNLLILDVPSLKHVERVPVSGTKEVAISPDGRRMAIAIPQGVILWDVSANKIVWTVPQTNVLHLAFSPNGELIAMASANRSIAIRNSIDGTLRNEFTNFRALGNGMTFSPDGLSLVSAMPDGAVIFTHVATGQELLQIPNVGIMYSIDLEFSIRDRCLVCRSRHNNTNPPMDAPDEIVILDGADPTDDENDQ